MSRVKTSPVPPGQTPAEFLASGPAVTPPAIDPENPPRDVKLPPPSTAAATPPGLIQEFRAPITPQTAPEPEQPASPPSTPAPQPVMMPDPFVELNRWTIGENERSLRALSVPGGCIVRLSVLRGIPPNFRQISESICFVPNVVVQDGMLRGVSSAPTENDEPKTA